MTLIDRAKQGIITDEMKVVASAEGVMPEFICRGIANGRIVLPVSPYRDTKPIGIGKGLKTKVNASVGTSSDIADVDLEVAKTKVAEAAGADSIMELSTAGDFYEIRRKVIEATSLSVGSVPLYQAFIEAARDSGSIVDMREDDLFRVTEEQAKLGTNF
ncbi:MAG: phosphomethylpyrimidine synthase ThiC, partial [Halobacteriota archaeon]